jgi:hypothetical protein
MEVQRKLLMLFAGAAPAVALAAGSGDHSSGRPSTTPPTNQGTAHKPSTPGPNASLPAKAKAYGKNCQDQSKTHVAGTPGTPFSKCVTDMAKLASGSTNNPRTACRDESKTHVAGTPGRLSASASRRRQAAQDPARRKLAEGDGDTSPGFEQPPIHA